MHEFAEFNAFTEVLLHLEKTPLISSGGHLLSTLHVMILFLPYKKDV